MFFVVFGGWFRRRILGFNGGSIVVFFEEVDVLWEFFFLLGG